MSDGRDNSGFDETLASGPPGDGGSAPNGDAVPETQAAGPGLPAQPGGYDETVEMEHKAPPLPPTPAEIEAKLSADGYEIIEELGRGGMGVVYKAEEKSLKRIVAIKLLSPAIATNPAASKRFRREAILAANLNHPSIVPVFNIDSADPPQYYTMEFVEGRSVKDAIDEEGPMPPGPVVFIARQALEALQHAHQRNIVHRDIKPANIMLDEKNNRVRVTDFGIAQDVSGTLAEVTVTGENTSVGTPAFMSPEQNSGVGLDARSDIFSLGATLYYSLTAQLPFQASNRQQLAMAFFSQLPATPGMVNRESPEWLDRVVLKMLSPRLEHRYQTCQEALADLNSGPAAAAAPVRFHRQRRWGKPAVRVAMLIALAAAGVMFGPKLWQILMDLRESGSPPDTPAVVDAGPTRTPAPDAPSDTPPTDAPPETPVADDPPTPDDPPVAPGAEPASAQQVFTLSPPPGGDGRFGWQPAVSERYIVVGAPHADARAGKAYVYDAQSGEFVAELSAGTRAQKDQFGCDVAISGPVAVVGAGGTNAAAGAAEVFGDTGNGQWRHVATLTPADATRLDWFGQSVAIDGDTIVVGAPGTAPGGRTRAWDPRFGAAYVFRNVAGQWRQVGKLLSPRPQEGEVFGFSVALAGPTIVIGAPELDIKGKGGAYVFREDAQGQWRMDAQLTSPDRRDSIVGFDVAASSDLILVGHGGDANEYAPSSGAAYLFNAHTGQVVARLTSPDPRGGDKFGHHVDLDGPVAVIGAPGDGETDSGCAFVFAPDADGQWQSVLELTPDERLRGDAFAAFAAMRGDRVVATSRTMQTVFVFQVSYPASNVVLELAPPRPTDDAPLPRPGDAPAEPTAPRTD